MDIFVIVLLLTTVFGCPAVVMSDAVEEWNYVWMLIHVLLCTCMIDKPIKLLAKVDSVELTIYYIFPKQANSHRSLQGYIIFFNDCTTNVTPNFHVLIFLVISLITHYLYMF